ncbi:MAG: shikimate kinase [Acidimicrobiia bacterium]
MTDQALRGHLVLIGPMGVGKTTVGRRVAHLLGCPFVDNDEVLERRAGRSAREMMATAGADVLHYAEAEALAWALRRPGPSVVAAAGSVVLVPAAGEALGEAEHVVWLQAAPATVASRVAAAAAPHRPAVADLGSAAAMAARAELYAEVATAVVDADGPPGTVAARVLAAIG